MPRVRILSDVCKGCGLCVRACPQGILDTGKKLNAKGYYAAVVAQPMRCMGCRLCAIACPDVAIELSVHGTMVHYFTY